MTIYKELEQHCKEIVRIANICYPSQQVDALDRLKPLVEATLQKLSDARPFAETKVKVVCLCGSTRFKDAHLKAQRDKTLAGEIVLTVGLFGHEENMDMSGEVKQRLDELHKRKIDLADYVYVLNVNGYVGSSTRSEITYASVIGKPVHFLEAT